MCVRVRVCECVRACVCVCVCVENDLSAIFRSCVGSDTALTNMACSHLTRVKRAFVSVLLALAAGYGVALTVNRDSEDNDILKGYRRVILKAHPDKGGDTAKFQELQAAKEKWDNARAAAPPPGNPHCAPGGLVQTSPPAGRSGKRVKTTAVLLTYSGAWSLPLWRSFVTFVRRRLAPWSVLHWCATLEESDAGRLHVHLALQFRQTVDRTTVFFAWKDRLPNASSNDYLGQGMCKNPRFLQASIDRGFFYVYADKDGTQRDERGQPCVAGNRLPCWDKTAKVTRYQVPGKWPQALWQQHKLSHENFDLYIFLCRDGVVSRKRNLDAVVAREEEEAEDRERKSTTKRVRANTFVPYPEVPAVTAWLALFLVETDRYPFLVILGPSRSYKTEYAKSLFKAPLELKLGNLAHFPDEMRRFSRKQHDAIVLDDCRDFQFLVEHQEKLQGKVDAKVEFASTPGGQCKYTKWLHRVPIVVTANFTTKNRELLESDDFLGHPENRVVVERARPVG